MCDYCSRIKDKNSLTDDGENYSMSEEIDMIIKGQRLVLSYDAYSVDSSFGESIKINFCPMCGRDLINEASKPK